MLRAMRGSTLERRAFVTLMGQALVGAGVLAISRPDPVPARDRDPNVFAGQETFEQLLTVGGERAWSQLPIGERIGAIGMALRQTPYVAATLELYEDREVCSVNLRGLDCVTFFESSLAFARMLRRGGRTPEALLAEIIFTRYRGGRLTDYVSRLHYLSDWFFDNEHKGVVRLTTGELPGATRFTKRVNFMSTHPKAYRQLSANPDLVRTLARFDTSINAREMQYVPRAKVEAARPHVWKGDLVGVTTRC